MSSGPLDGEILPPEEEERLKTSFWPTFKRAFRQLPFAQDVVAAYYCALDPEVPGRVRATLLAALAYFVLPFDTIPDFIVGVGFGDDATVLLAAITMVATHITPAHRAKAADALSDGASS